MDRIRALKFVDRLIGKIAVRCFLPTSRQDKAISFNSFLIIRPGGIGDAVLLSPLIRVLTNSFPDADIDILAEKRNRHIFSCNSLVRKIYSYDNPKDFLKVLSNKYDIVIDSEQWHSLSAIVARLSRAPMKIGYATNDRNRLFSHAIPYSQEDYEADSFLNLLRPLNIAKPFAMPMSFLDVPADAAQKVRGLLGALVEKPFVAIFPGASIPERRWDVNKFAEVAKRLDARGISIVVVGGRGDSAAGDKIIAGTSGLNLAGKTSIAETAAVIDRSKLLLSGDSGILHIGIGLDKPTVSLFGPGMAKKWAPRGNRHIVINKGLPCSPCTRFGTTPRCPINTRCMADISVNEVIAAVDMLLRNTAPHLDGADGAIKGEQFP